jgi:hypothetical protein
LHTRSIAIVKHHLPALLLALSLASPSAFAGMQDFSVLNLTPDTILSVHASPSGNADWEEDMLGDAVIDPGENQWFSIEGYDDCLWDIQVVRLDAPSGDGFYGVDLCAVAGLVLVVSPQGEIMAIPVYPDSPGLPAWAAQMQAPPAGFAAAPMAQAAPAVQSPFGMPGQLPPGIQPIRNPTKMICVPNFFQMSPEQQRETSYGMVMSVCYPSAPTAEGRQTEIDARYAGMQSQIDGLLDSARDTKVTTYGVSRYAIDPTGSTVTWDPAAANRFGIPYVPFSPEIYH